MPKAPRLVLVRHGQSTWNKEKRFTGWENPSLSEKGQRDAVNIGRALAAAGATFDVAYTSYLSRAIETLWLVQQTMDLMWIPVTPDWRFNERHYGALQGLNKDKTREQYGEEQVYQWRRSYDTPPPAGGDSPAGDDRYKDVPVPQGESLADTRRRAAGCLGAHIKPQLKDGKRVLVVAHGNLLRALIMEVEDVPPDDIAKVQIGTAHAVLYREANADGMPLAPRQDLAPQQ